MEKICNDPRLFKKYFYDDKSGLRDLILSCDIEHGESLEDYADISNFPSDKLLYAVLRSLREDGKHNKPLQRGIFDCYYFYDSEDYDIRFQTFDTEKEWLEAVREYCCEKRIWEYENEIIYTVNKNIVLSAL